MGRARSSATLVYFLFVCFCFCLSWKSPETSKTQERKNYYEVRGTGLRATTVFHALAWENQEIELKLVLFENKIKMKNKIILPILVALKANMGGGGGISLWQATGLAVRLTTPPLSLYMKQSRLLFLYGCGRLSSFDQVDRRARGVAITNWVPSASNHLPWQEYAVREKNLNFHWRKNKTKQAYSFFENFLKRSSNRRLPIYPRYNLNGCLQDKKKAKVR